ncbi:MAG: extracellular solute-binding protein [Eubacteriaceae bacterium]|nr:extracellular solute-binding protein [Eubacteriaceae bacterium]
MKKFAKALYLVLILMFLYLPIGTLMVLSFNQSKSMSVWSGFSLKWYKEMFQNPMIMEAVWNTFTIALIAAAVATIIGTVACIGIAVMKKRSENVIMALTNIPMLNADIVTGISLMMTFLAFGISLNRGTVLLSHITFCLPYVILSVMPKFKQTTGQTYEAALDLGASPLYAFMKVVIPEIRPGIVSGFLLSFTMSVDDFVITHFTRGAGINTISTLIYSQVKVGIRPTLFALSTLIFVTVLILLLASNISGGSEDEGGKNYSEKKTKAKKALSAVLTCAVIVLLGGVLFASGITANKTDDEVHVYCFGDYIDPELINEFEEETGIKVVMDTFDTNEEMYPVIKNESVNYDVICASDYMIEKLAKEGLLAELNRDNIPNYDNLMEKYMEISESFDKGNRYSVPHTWGTLGIMYNTKTVKEGEITSWNDLWKEKYKQRIVMPDSLRDTFAIALKAKGYSLNSKDENEVREAADYLIKQKPLVYKYANDSARDLILGGSVDIAAIWSGEVLYSQEEDPDLAFVVPEEGSEQFIDAWAVPASARNKNSGEAWINFMLKKETAITNYDYLTYTIPNKAVYDYIKEDDETSLPVIFPDDTLVNRCEALINLGGEADDMYSKEWKRFKS